MHSKSTLILAAILVVIAISVTTVQARQPAQQMPTCSDKTNIGNILGPVTTYADAYSKVTSAATPEDFAAIIDAGIQAKHTVGDLSIDPTKDPGCFYAQLSVYGLLSDEVDTAIYQSFVKAGLKGSDAYTKALTDLGTRATKDANTMKAMFATSDSGAATQAATTNP